MRIAVALVVAFWTLGQNPVQARGFGGGHHSFDGYGEGHGGFGRDGFSGRERGNGGRFDRHGRGRGARADRSRPYAHGFDHRLDPEYGATLDDRER